MKREGFIFDHMDDEYEDYTRQTISRTPGYSWTKQCRLNFTTHTAFFG